MGKNSIKAVVWFILSLVTSVANDSITKLLSNSISASTVSFWRFAFSTVTLLLVIGFTGVSSIKTKKVKLHIVRGLILSFAMSLWAYGIKFVPISTVTLMSFTVPMFTIVMATVFLKEKISIGTILATIIGFAGSLFTLSPVTFSLVSLVFIVASILFATLDIINKMLINKGEKTMAMLFYSNLFSALFASLAPGVEFSIGTSDTILLLILGIGANLILFFIVKAFTIAKASFLAPVRYLELVISALVGLIFFGEGLSLNIAIGGGMIILSSLLIDTRLKIDGCKKRS